MKPKSTPHQNGQPYTNGHYETSLEISEVSLRPPAPINSPTTFAPDLLLRGWGPLLYALTRFQLVALPVARLALLFLLLVAVLAGIGVIPGHWVTSAMAILLCILYVGISSYFRRRQYSSFSPALPPNSNDSPLQTNEKLPIYATGLMSVDGRYQRYCALSGFYRTFATGEHALLCLVQVRSWLGVFTWPADEIGMWYAFVSPSEIQSITWGNLCFGSTSYPAIAVDYLLQLPPGPRRKRVEIRRETLYVATTDPNDAKRLYMDLTNNLSIDKIPAPLAAHS